MKKTLLLFTISALIFIAGCDNIDPGVKPSGSETVTVQTVSSAVNTAADTAEETESLPEYINADALAHRSYELRYLLAQEKFDSPDDISVNALVQYAFCHLYYDDLIAMPRTGNKLRQATADEINQEILENFGEVGTDITKADLYNSGRKCFEMWEPLYGTDIYYDVTVVPAGDDTYKASTTFYGDSAKKEIIGKTVLTVEDADGSVLIRKLSSSK